MGVELTFASYNIHKAVGLDRRRDPERILSVLHELKADVIALQEADRRFGRRIATLPRSLLAEHHWQIAPVAKRPDSIGWHGNALLVRAGIEIDEAHAIDLPMLEPRGAVSADLRLDGKAFRAVGMHLDISGLRRRHQLEAILAHLERLPGDPPVMMMGDLNEWTLHGGCLHCLPRGWQHLAPGASFPSRQPVARLDRLMYSPGWKAIEAGVHHSALSAQASDHLPVRLRAKMTA